LDPALDIEACGFCKDTENDGNGQV
jgi:hypothetical protein